MYYVMYYYYLDLIIFVYIVSNMDKYDNDEIISYFKYFTKILIFHYHRYSVFSIFIRSS